MSGGMSMRIVLALEAYDNRYFNFAEEGVADLELEVLRAWERYGELKSQGKGFTYCSRIAREEMVRRLLTAASATETRQGRDANAALSRSDDGATRPAGGGRSDNGAALR